MDEPAHLMKKDINKLEARGDGDGERDEGGGYRKETRKRRIGKKFSDNMINIGPGPA